VNWLAQGWNHAVSRVDLDRFRLRTLGRFELSRAGRILDVRSPKSRALLVCLALSPGGRIARGALAGLLWDRADPENARASLRQALAALRTVLGADFAALVAADTREVWIDLRCVDVDLLELASGAGRVEEMLDAAMTSFEFLADLVPDSPAMEDWLALHRARASTLAIMAVEAALADVRARGDCDAVLALGAKGLLLDPLHEGVHAAMIEAFVQQGRHGLARAHAARARRQFMDELGAKPVFPALDGHDARLPGAQGDDDRSAVAVVAFTGADAGAAAALADAVVGHLSRSLWLRVISTRQPGARGVALYLEGVAGAWLELRLTDPSDGTVLWTDTVAPSGGEPGLADRAAARAESAILAAEAHRHRDHGHASAGAGRARLMHARWLFWRTSQHNNAAAGAILDRLLDLNPGNARALALRAFVWLADAWSGWSDDPAGACAEGLRLARRAVRAEPECGWPVFALATAETTTAPLDQAERTMRRALTLSPALAPAHGELGRILACKGDRTGAEAACVRAQALSPNDAHASLWALSKAMAAFATGDYAGAREGVVAAAGMRGEWFQNELLHAACALRLGEAVAARAYLNSALRKTPRYSLAALRAGFPFAASAVVDDFVDALRELGWNA